MLTDLLKPLWFSNSKQYHEHDSHMTLQRLTILSIKIIITVLFHTVYHILSITIFFSWSLKFSGKRNRMPVGFVAWQVMVDMSLVARVGHRSNIACKQSFKKLLCSHFYFVLVLCFPEHVFHDLNDFQLMICLLSTWKSWDFNVITKQRQKRNMWARTSFSQLES